MEPKDNVSIHKRQERKRTPKKTKQPSSNQCECFLKQKNRRCGMRKMKDLRFCADHTVLIDGNDNDEQDRVPCPLDAKHSVKVAELEYHVRKCNARPTKAHDPWYSKDTNAQLHSSGEQETEFPANNEENREDLESDLDSFKELFRVLEEYSRKVSPLDTKVQQHKGLERWFLQKGNKKHVTQQSSLVAALKEAELLSQEKFYVEFGCGRAELSRMVNACVVFDSKFEEKSCHNKYGYGLIDRGTNRMKMDSKIVTDCEHASIIPQIKRSRIDIQHLDLDAFLSSVEHGLIVAISKHLCGAATDLTLKLILNSEKSKHLLDGVVVAMCCRHVCEYQQLLPQSRAYLSQNGVSDSTAFGVLKRVVSWAVCSRVKGHEGDHHVTGLTYDEREWLGLVARRMIDDSRVAAINQLMGEHTAELFLYADKETTLENHCLRITRRQSLQSVSG